MKFLALTRPLPRSISHCELTHLAREPIDYARAVTQHERYEAALERLGCRIERLPAAPDLPDSVFVEDAAVVFDEVAVLTRPGAPSRRREVESVADALRAYRPLSFIEPPGTLDGGDVLVTPRGVFVGVSARTNVEGARQLGSLLDPHGFTVTTVPVTGCLHLKSAVTLASDDTLLVNAGWIDLQHFTAFQVVHVDAAEPSAANVLRIGDRVLCATEHPRTRERLEVRGIATLSVETSELAKAEGGLTCCSLLLRV